MSRKGRTASSLWQARNECRDSIRILTCRICRNWDFWRVGLVGFEVNLFLATFNMLPVMPLDGAKVFRWNKLLWRIFRPATFQHSVIFFGL